MRRRGRLVIDTTAVTSNGIGVPIVNLYGPNGGELGSVPIEWDDVRTAYNRLGAALEKHDKFVAKINEALGL